MSFLGIFGRSTSAAIPPSNAATAQVPPVGASGVGATPSTIATGGADGAKKGTFEKVKAVFQATFQFIMSLPKRIATKTKELFNRFVAFVKRDPSATNGTYVHIPPSSQTAKK